MKNSWTKKIFLINSSLFLQRTFSTRNSKFQTSFATFASQTHTRNVPVFDAGSSLYCSTLFSQPLLKVSKMCRFGSCFSESCSLPKASCTASKRGAVKDTHFLRVENTNKAAELTGPDLGRFHSWNIGQGELCVCCA